MSDDEGKYPFYLIWTQFRPNYVHPLALTPVVEGLSVARRAAEAKLREIILFHPDSETSKGLLKAVSADLAVDAIRNTRMERVRLLHSASELEEGEVSRHFAFDSDPAMRPMDVGYGVIPEATPFTARLRSEGPAVFTLEVVGGS